MADNQLILTNNEVFTHLVKYEDICKYNMYV